MNEIVSAIEKILDSKLSASSDKLLDSQEACFFLGISKSTLYKMNLRKEVPYYKPGKKVYYSKSDLLNYITRNRFKSSSELNEEAKRFLNLRKGGDNV
jgi:excisionase family DNA binding protein